MGNEEFLTPSQMVIFTIIFMFFQCFFLAILLEAIDRYKELKQKHDRDENRQSET